MDAQPPPSPHALTEASTREHESTSSAEASLGAPSAEVSPASASEPAVGAGTLSLLQAACATKFQLPIRKTERGGEHRKSCHMCGNVRKTITLCINKDCPQVFCRNCIAKALEQHGSGVFNKGCAYCKRLCCCGLSRSSPTCLNKYHCYRKCPVTKRADADQIELIANADITSLWHEPHCTCSKEFKQKYMNQVENAENSSLSEGALFPMQSVHSTVKIRRKRDVRGQSTPRFVFSPSDDDLAHVSVGTSPEAQSQASSLVSSSFAGACPSLVLPPPRAAALPANDYSSLFDPTSTTSFFDQCEEEFRSGLRKVNIDRIVSKYEEALLPHVNVNELG